MSSSTAASLSAVRVSFTDARAQSAASSFGDSYQVTAGNQNERLLMPSEMRGLGGGLSSSTLDDTRKFRWDKPSRIFRLQRGTKFFRFTLLFLSVLIVFSGYFQFDLPAITVNSLLERLKINMSQYSTIFVGYSVSNTIVPLLSGAFFGKVGKWKGVVIISTTITIGIMIVYFGIVANSYPVVVLGRTIYGLGGESVFVGIDILVTKWFQGAEIGFAYGLIQAAGQAGSFTALYSVPPLVKLFGDDIDNVYLISLMLSLTALAALGLARCLEKTAYGRGPKKVVVEAGHLHADKVLSSSAAGGFATAFLDDGIVTSSRSKPKASNVEEGARLLGSQPIHSKDNAKGLDEKDEEDDEEEESDTDVVSDKLRAQLEHNLRWFRCIPPLFHLMMFLGFGHMFTLGWRFYCTLGGIICYSSAFYTFLAFGPKWLMTSYDVTEADAGQTTATIAIFSMIVSPTAGLIMDSRGGQRFVCFGAMLSACIWFAIMGFSRLDPKVCIVFAGFSYSLLPASLYPLLPEFVPDESFTTVYAILNSLINLVFTIVLLISGSVLGAGDVSELSATRGGARIAAGMLANLPSGLALVGDDPAGEEATAIEPSKFNAIFGMFVTITAFGTFCTGLLALDAYKLMKQGIDLKPRKGGH
jgi:MFS family permease